MGLTGGIKERRNRNEGYRLMWVMERNGFVASSKHVAFSLWGSVLIPFDLNGRSYTWKMTAFTCHPNFANKTFHCVCRAYFFGKLLRSDMALPTLTG